VTLVAGQGSDYMRRVSKNQNRPGSYLPTWTENAPLAFNEY